MGCREHLDVALLVELIAFSGGAGLYPPHTTPRHYVFVRSVQCQTYVNFIVHFSVVYSADVFLHI